MRKEKHALGVRLYHEGRFAEARAMLREALDAEATSEEWNDWATAELACGCRAQAESGYRRALRLDPSNVKAIRNFEVLIKLPRNTDPVGPQPAQWRSRVKLSIIMPSNRNTLSAYARILDTCSSADDRIEVIIRDNSGDPEKREFLSRIHRKNCNIAIVDPCGGGENWRGALSLAQGDFIFFISDDDAFMRASANAIAELITKHCGDPSVAGITGQYIVEDCNRTAVFTYPTLDAAAASQRLAAYLGAHGLSYLIYSAIRRSIVKDVVGTFCQTVPFWFPFSDQLIALMYLLSGRFVSVNRAVYQYDASNWDTPERCRQTDLRYYSNCGLDGSILRLHWLICAMEGAKVVLGKFKGVDMPLSERPAAAALWFQLNYSRFLGNMNRTDSASRHDQQAILLCDKWRKITQISLDQLLADISDFIALSDREGGEKYFRFWKD